MPSEDDDSIISQLFFGKKKEFITYYQAVIFDQIKLVGKLKFKLKIASFEFKNK